MRSPVWSPLGQLLFQQATDGYPWPVILRGPMNGKSSAMTLACRAFRCLMPLAILVSAGAVALAQTPRATPDPGLPRLNRQNDPDPMTSIEEEMRAKRAIKFAEKEYQENIERARELADLGSKLGESFKKNECFDREDWKRLDRLEKLTKAIRSAAGGSDSEKGSGQVLGKFHGERKQVA